MTDTPPDADDEEPRSPEPETGAQLAPPKTLSHPNGDIKAVYVDFTLGSQNTEEKENDEE